MQNTFTLPPLTHNEDNHFALGSSQYDTIADACTWALPLLQSNRTEFENALGISYTKQLSESELIEELKTEIESYIQEDITWNQENPDPNYEPPTLPGIISIETHQEFFKHQSSDLWSSYIIPFEDWDLNIPTSFQPNTEGLPLFNALAQDDNTEIGILIAYCILLYGATLSDFAGYDT